MVGRNQTGPSLIFKLKINFLSFILLRISQRTKISPNSFSDVHFSALHRKVLKEVVGFIGRKFSLLVIH